MITLNTIYRFQGNLKVYEFFILYELEQFILYMYKNKIKNKNGEGSDIAAIGYWMRHHTTIELWR